MTRRFRERTFADIILIFSGILIVFISPEFAWFPKGCILQKITGFYCAGCGVSRSIHSLLRFDLYSAMHQNFLLVTVFPLSLLWLTYRFLILKHSKNIKKYDSAVIIFFIIVVVVFTVLRNVPSQLFNFIRP